MGMCNIKESKYPVDNFNLNNQIKMIKKILISKKTINLIKNSNIITFEVRSVLNKRHMKNIIKILFGHKIEKINSLIGKKSYKKYFVKIDQQYSANEIISCLGFIIE